MIETLHWLDHIIVLIFTVGLGAAAFWKMDEFLRRVAAGEDSVRSHEYRKTILHQWIVTGAALIVWFFITQREPGELGLGWMGGWRFWSGVALTLAGLALLCWQAVTARTKKEAREYIRQQLQPMEPLVPHTLGEYRWFVAVSFTAGICEEILYRGYLLAYLLVWFPLWLAATIAVIAFGLAHAYQMRITKGPGGVIRTMIFGAVAMGLYLLTNSLWCSIILHVAVDMNAGYLAYLIYAKFGDEANTTPASVIEESGEE
mgnify:CR=1 FL=1